MGNEEFKKTRTSIDLVGMTSVGTTMAKASGFKFKKTKSSDSSKFQSKGANEAKKSEAAAAAKRKASEAAKKPPSGGAKPPPAKKKP